jgi:hypothetical protein
VFLGVEIASDGGGMDVGGVAGLVEESSLRNVLLWERAFVQIGKVRLGEAGIGRVWARRQALLKPQAEQVGLKCVGWWSGA